MGLKLVAVSLVKQFTPIGNNILVLEDEETEKKSSGGVVLLTGGGHFQIKFGKVVVAGEGKLLDDNTLVRMRVKAGDRIVFSEFAACNALNEDSRRYWILDETQVLGVLT